MKYFFCFLWIAFSLPSAAYFYPSSYLESRKAFKDISEAFHDKAGFSQMSLTVPGQSEIPLTIDGLYFSSSRPNKEHLVIVTSGVHGVEAFTGAAIQIEFLKEVLKNQSRYSHLSFLFLHSINPYGFHHKRRVDENNIDLNRNFSATSKEFNKKILNYEAFDNYINPKKPAVSGYVEDALLFLKSLVKLVIYGKKQMTQVSVGGQYQNSKGIYYGGQRNQINGKLVKEVFLKYGSPFKKIMHIDLHTGFGERGTLHFFSSKKVANIKGFDQIFKGFKIDKGTDDHFYKTSGDFSNLTLNVFEEKEVVIPMTFEFGTMNSQTIIGGFHSLKNMIYENQGFHYGFKSQEDEAKIKRDFMNMFNPSEKAWRDNVVTKGVETLETVVHRFSNI